MRGWYTYDRIRSVVGSVIWRFISASKATLFSCQILIKSAARIKTKSCLSQAAFFVAKRADPFPYYTKKTKMMFNYRKETVMNGDEKQKGAESREEQRARRRKRTSQVMQMLQEQEEARKTAVENQAAVKGGKEKPADPTRESDETKKLSGSASGRMEEPTEADRDAEAIETGRPQEQADPVMDTEEPAQGMGYAAGRMEEAAGPAMEDMETAPEDAGGKDIEPADSIIGSYVGGREPDGQEAENDAMDKAETEMAQEETKELQEHEAVQETDVPTGADAGAIDKEDEQEEASRTDSIGQEAQEEPTQEPQGKEKENASQQQEQGQPGAGDKDPRQKQGRDGQPFHKDDPHKGKDEQSKGLFSRMRLLVLRIFHRIKHMVERVIGRGHIPTLPRVNRADLSRSAMDLSGKDKPSVDRETKDKEQEQQQGRDWRDLIFHGFARRILGRDAYMYAVQQTEKQEVARQGKDTQGQEHRGQAPKETVRQSEEKRVDRTEHPGNQEKPASERSGDAHTQSQGKAEKGTEQQKQQKEPEEMGGKINSLHKIITNDLEDRYTNAREAKETYLANYAAQLQEKLTEINHEDPVQVSVSREDGKLKICINHEQEQFGGYPMFMGCARIQIEIDGHLNITSAEALIPTKQSEDGKISGRKIDVSETLGAYIISDLAKNFREDYNRGSESYNLASRNEFEKTIRDAAAQGRGGFMIDNIPYSISVNQDQTIQISPAAGEGRAFIIAMDAASQQTEAAREAYESKAQELQDTERALGSARRTYDEMKAERQQLQEKYNQASDKADAAIKKYKDIQKECYQIDKQMSGKYLGADEMAAQEHRRTELEAERKTAFKVQQQANKDRNMAHAAVDTADRALQGQKLKSDALEQKAEALREACKEAKEQYDIVSLKQKETVMEAYQAHTSNVAENRESSIRVFEEILPGCKNDIGGDFKLEDLNRTMEETGRTSMEEAISAQEMGDGQTEPPRREDHEASMESQELGAEIV